MALILSLVPFVFASESDGKESGGGGGTIHDQFIGYGIRVLYYLRHDPAGQQLVKAQKLNLCRLKAALSENFIHVSQLPADKFTDVRGSRIDAYTYPWRIEIQKDVWEEHFQNQRDVYNLVFKEMLRSEGTYFNNAIFISNQIFPFSAKYKISVPFSTLAANLDFQDWMAKDGYCIYKKDIKFLKRMRDGYHNFLENEPPLCKQTDPQDEVKTPKNENVIEFLERKSQLEGCIIQPEPCLVTTRSTPQAANQVLNSRVVIRGGQLIYKDPQSIVTNDIEIQYVTARVPQPSAETMLKRLVRAGFCKAVESETPVSRMSKISSKNGLTLFYQLAEKPNIGLIATSQKLLATDSVVELVSPRLTGHLNTFLVQVKVIENPLVQTSLAKAEIGEVGYIDVNTTQFDEYVDRKLFELVFPD